jgi:hypothetical protein
VTIFGIFIKKADIFLKGETCSIDKVMARVKTLAGIMKAWLNLVKCMRYTCAAEYKSVNLPLDNHLSKSHYEFTQFYFVVLTVAFNGYVGTSSN